MREAPEMMIVPQNHGILRYIIPRYDEISLFAMSFTCTLLMVVGLFSTSEIRFHSPARYERGMLLVFLVFFTGLVLSIYHALVNRPKLRWEKLCMLVFAVLMNAFTGLLAGAYAFSIADGWLTVFPILNILNSVLLLSLLRSRVITESDISDQNASHVQVAFTAAVVTILFRHLPLHCQTHVDADTLNLRRVCYERRS